MKKYVSILLTAVMAVSLAACGGSDTDTLQTEESVITTEVTENSTQGGETESQTQENDGGKDLVAYFSYAENADLPDNAEASTSASIDMWNGKTTGNTGVVAGMIANAAGGDIHSILTAEKYPGNYNDTLDQAQNEGRENARPELVSSIENFDEYDTVFVGFPNWWGDMPMALYSFFDEYDFSGKTIIPFCTSGGSGFSDAINTMKELEPDANVIEDGLSVSASGASGAESEVNEWLNGLEY